jgi:hypothetical protein
LGDASDDALASADEFEQRNVPDLVERERVYDECDDDDDGGDE